MTRLAGSFGTNFSKQLVDCGINASQLLVYSLQLGLHRLHVDTSHKQDPIDGTTAVLVEVPAIKHGITKLLTFTVFLHAANEGRCGVL
jgi:hypothetical protein